MKFYSQLFMATALNGNNEVVILRFALAPVENIENWTWFCTLLWISIIVISDQNIPLISYKQKGLLVAVKDIFSSSIHGHCAFHLKSNIKQAFDKFCKDFFWPLIYAQTKIRFQEQMNSLSQIRRVEVIPHYIRQMDLRLWSRNAFLLPWWGKVYSNLAE